MDTKPVKAAMAQIMRIALLSLAFYACLVVSFGFNLNKLRQGSSSISNTRQSSINHGDRGQQDILGNNLFGFKDPYPMGWGGGEELRSFADLQSDFLAGRDFILVIL